MFQKLFYAVGVNQRFDGGTLPPEYFTETYIVIQTQLKGILAELLGKRPRINPTGYRDSMAMLRYDESVFVPNASKLK